MQPSLKGIANKAAKDKQHRFGDLFRMLNLRFLLWCFKFLNLNAAPGIDWVDARVYRENLHENVSLLVERVKEKRYRAKLVRRQYIPKDNGKLRALGILVIDDKLLQTGATRILEAIYEQDFLPCSYGYRPGIGAHDAIRDLSRELQDGPYEYIVEADIKGFFDNIDHDILLEMLALRIDDKAFLGLIRKWLKAGVLETDGSVIHPATGTPQGGIISPVLANVYLHYALDVWFEQVVKTHCKGKAYLCRYADDFVCAFELKQDAERFYEVLGKRLGKFKLELAAEKTRIVHFSRHTKQDEECFDFLGFEFRWRTTRKGKDQLSKTTSRKKFRKSVANFTAWIKKSRSLKLKEIMAKTNMKLKGYYNYYGLRGNYEALAVYFQQVKEILFKWLNRRSQRKSFTWEVFQKILKRFNIARPRITEKPVISIAVACA